MIKEYNKTNCLSLEDLQVWKSWCESLSNQTLIMPKPVRRKKPKKINQTIDLHGLTLQQAYDLTKTTVEACVANKTKMLTVITGKSGQISREFLYWLQSIKNIKRIDPIVDKSKQIGSYKIVFK